jgi:hypothetical protein
VLPWVGMYWLYEVEVAPIGLVVYVDGGKGTTCCMGTGGAMIGGGGAMNGGWCGGGV